MPSNRFILEFTLEKPEFPIEYRKAILSFIKKSLSECNKGKYYNNYFRDTIQKDYCFSVELPKPKYNKEKIELANNIVKVKFSVDDRNKTELILFSAFIAQKGKNFKLENNNSMILKSIKKLGEKNIVNNRAIFKTSKGSAICVREHNKEKNIDKYYTYNENEFKEKFHRVLENQLKNIASKEDISNIIVNPIQCRKSVIKHYGIYIDGNIGIFEIIAKPYILQYLYNVGIGSRKSAGFGMLDLITNDLTGEII